MADTATRSDLDLRLVVDGVFRRQREATRAMESALAWDVQLRQQAMSRLGWPATATTPFRTIRQLDWPQAPAPVADAIRFWEALPRVLDDIISAGGFPAIVGWLGRRAGFPYGTDQEGRRGVAG